MTDTETKKSEQSPAEESARQQADKEAEAEGRRRLSSRPRTAMPPAPRK